jgi:predicted transcriptional regulator
MPKRSSYEIKEKVLTVIREKPMTYAQLERKVNTGFRTIKSNCEELEQFGQVKIKKIDEHPANGKPSYEIRITEQGLSFLAKNTKKALKDRFTS